MSEAIVIATDGSKQATGAVDLGARSQGLPVGAELLCLDRSRAQAALQRGKDAKSWGRIEGPDRRL
jgi:hypothetical protein